ncbi:hypothetical protein C8R42DRAFT_717159 [Lentinula raphanica]|nr:hypothetical protein C8R42DRAFT_717159 [Lentinula raphanica]
MLPFTHRRRMKPSSASLQIRSALLLFCFISITSRAADEGDPVRLYTVIHDKSGSSSPSEAPAPLEHQELAHVSPEAYGSSAYSQPAYGAALTLGTPAPEVPTHEATVEYQMLEICFTAFVNKDSKRTPYINLEIGDEYSFTPVTITTKVKLLPTKGESSWRALFRYNTRGVVNGRKRIGHVKFPAGIDSKAIMERVEGSIRAGGDENLWTKHVSIRKDVFIDYLRELKETDGVVIEEEVIDHITVAMDQYEKEWEKRKQNRGNKGSGSK